MAKKIPQTRVLYRRSLRTIGLGLLLVLGLAISIFLQPSQHAAAATSSYINFQARLQTASGGIVPDGFYNIEFKIYNAASSGTSSQGSCTGDANCLWTETRTSGNTVRVKNGYLTVNLGSVTTLPAIDYSQELWLTMRVGGTGAPSWDAEMTPRLQITAVPYAFKAGDSATLGGIASSGFIQNTTSPQSANLYVTAATNGSVAGTFRANAGGAGGILNLLDATGASVANFDVFGNLNAQNISANAGVIANAYTTGVTALNAIQNAASGTVPVAIITGGATPGAGADLLQLQNSSTQALAGFNNAGQLYLGRAGAAGATGSLKLFNSTNANTITIQSGVTTTGYTLTLPTALGASGDCLKDTTGAGVLGFASCGGGSGVTTVGSFSGSSQLNGANITGTTITFGPADATNPGMVTTGTQTIAGNKTFNGNIIGGSNLNITGDATITGNVISHGNANLIKPTINSSAAFQIQPAASTTPVFDVDTGNGRVGIGTATPNDVFSIVTADNTVGLNHQNAGGTIQLITYIGNSTGTCSTNISSCAEFGTATNTALMLGTNATPRLFITGSGSVGIGVDNPGYALHVAGEINATTGFRTNGNTGLASLTCSGGQLLQNAVVVGGIVTGGSCVAAGGVTSVGAISGTSNANGATIAAGVLTLTPADATNGGVVTNTTQSFAGDKTFTGNVSIAGGKNLSMAAGAGVFTQSYNATTATTAQTLTLSNASGTQTNGILVNRNGAGTTDSAINITNTTGTLNNGLNFVGTIGADINRTTGTLAINGGSGINNKVAGTTIEAVSSTGISVTGGVTASGTLAINGTGNSNIAGKLAIGTASPGGSQLLVVGASATNVASFSDGTATGAYYIDNGTTTPVQFGSVSNHNLGFFTNNGSPQLVLTTANQVGIGTQAPADKLDVEGGNIRIGAQTNGTTAFAKISGTAGTIGGGATTGIDNVYASAVFNGSLYVGTAGADDKAEVYRYNGGSSWTKVSNATAGTIAAGGTTLIDEVISMVVYNGSLYIGTYEATVTNKAEIYRYDGGTSWTKVSNATAGTISATGATGIGGVQTLAVYNGKLYAGTVVNADVYRYEGGTTWTRVNPSGGTMGSTSGIDGIRTLQVYNGALYAGTDETASGAEVYRYDGGTTWVRISSSIQGQIAAGGTTAIAAIYSMAVYNGALYIGTLKASGNGEVYRYEPTQATGGTNWFKVGAASFCGTATEEVPSLTVYNGLLYASTQSVSNGTSVCRYDGVLGSNAEGTWTRVSNAQGQISVGASTAEEMSHLQAYNGSLYAYAGSDSGTNLNKTEIHVYTNVTGQSYALNFNGASDNAGAEQAGFPNLGSISFLGEAQTGAAGSTSVNDTGTFLFSHGITTGSGAYDLAEDYPTRDDSLVAGDLVAADSNEAGMVRKANGPSDTVVGIYSENPGFRLSQSDATIDGARAVPIALAGRVPLKVTSASGDIKAGDFLAASNIPGVAIKATHAGPVVGRALASYSSTDTAAIGKVMVLINLSWFDPSVMTGLQGAVATSEAAGSDGSLALQAQDNTDTTTSTTPASLNQLQGDITTLATRTTKLEKQASKLNAQLQTIQSAFDNLGSDINTGKLTATSLAVTGDAKITGDLTVMGTATVGTLQLTGHLITKGDAPEVSLELAAGSHDTLALQKAKVEVIGNDTSGTILLTPGDGANIGRLVKLAFNKQFGDMPRVLLTPLGKDSSTLPVYVDEVQDGYFVLGGSSLPEAGKTYQYTYYVIQ